MVTSKANPHREIERKFLLKQLPTGLTSYPRHEIEQGYLAIENDTVQVRLRKSGETRSLTFKRGKRNAREEREIQLSAEQFEALWPGTAGRRLSKIRYDVPWRESTVEVDIYTGRHEGMIVAEVEFPDEESCADFIAPDWFGADVTDEARYSNVRMAQA
jgi:adenylate cyclase